MRFDPDCPWRHGCRPHDVAYRVSRIHYANAAPRIAWRERLNGFSLTARLQRGDYSGSGCDSEAGDRRFENDSRILAFER